MPTFTPPVDHYGNEGPQEPLWVWFVHFDRGVSLLKTDGVYTLTPFPTTDELDAADVVYLGGHIYDIDNDEATALIAAGYGDGVTPDLWSGSGPAPKTWDTPRTWGSS